MSVLAARDLGFGYPRFPVGRGVDLEVRTGEVHCLLGPNGSGKTTLFKTLLGLLPAQAGAITLDGENLLSLPRKQVAKKLAYVPQAHAATFPYSVLDMVLMARTAHRGLFSSPTTTDRDRAMAALEQLGVEALAERDYTRISGGQRQLVLIARALAQDASLIIMDEPTASLDFGNQVRVLAEVKTLKSAGLGVVLSTHNPDHAFASADRVQLLADGAIQAAGPPAEVLSGEALSSVYGVPIDVETLEGGGHVCVARSLRWRGHLMHPDRHRLD